MFPQCFRDVMAKGSTEDAANPSLRALRRRALSTSVSSAEQSPCCRSAGCSRHLRPSPFAATAARAPAPSRHQLRVRWQLLPLLCASAALLPVPGLAAKFMFTKGCEVEDFTSNEGHIRATGSSRVCAWRIRSESLVDSFSFMVMDLNLQGNDRVYFFSSSSLDESSLVGVLVNPTVPAHLVLRNSQEVVVVLQANHPETRFECTFSVELSEEISFFGRSFKPMTFGIILALTVVLALVIITSCCFGICFYWHFRQARYTIEHSEVLSVEDLMARRRLERQRRDMVRETLAEAAEPHIVAALEALPTRQWGADLVSPAAEAGDKQEASGVEECTLCLEKFEESDSLRVLPCSHHFHKDCIDSWFASKRLLMRTCPLCRQNAARLRPQHCPIRPEFAHDADLESAAPRAEVASTTPAAAGGLQPSALTIGYAL
eukprot:TRINITY_DN30590_c0_g1_i1.p1 TRINITY_DN30590_c0_g1~~TRINITY_DN30590_c0_g1_i1.p1  ORF type:complete len:432 (-),score=70.34 TRINITY_DN30590_c0_g1_i1:75-1370(-)